MQEDVWSTQSQFFPVRYSHTAYHRILLEFLASQMSSLEASFWVLGSLRCSRGQNRLRLAANSGSHKQEKVVAGWLKGAEFLSSASVYLAGSS